LFASSARATSENDRSRAASFVGFGWTWYCFSRFEKQYHVQPNPTKLAALDLSFSDVARALEANNAVDAGHSRHGLNLGPDDPVLHRAQVSGLLQLRLQA
jgi:hypothetical protein